MLIKEGELSGVDRYLVLAGCCTEMSCSALSKRVCHLGFSLLIFSAKVIFNTKREMKLQKCPQRW